MLDKIKIFLWDKNLFIKEKTNPPRAFPIKTKEPILAISKLWHSILYSVIQLYLNDSTTV